MAPLYFDYAASTPLDVRVQREIRKAEALYGNPSSFNGKGREAREALERARTNVAKFLNARPREIVFTSSGSEANNLAVLGLAKHFKKGEIIASAIEHPSLLAPLKKIPQSMKYYIAPVDSEGVIKLNELDKLITPKTILISLIYANNEIGTIQPIKKIKRIIREKEKEYSTKILFHIDACQATGYLEMNVQNLGVDILTLNSSKVYGPRGVGALFIRTGVVLDPLIHGGDQEARLRAGTENLAGIIGFAKALSLVKPQEGERLKKLRDYFFEKMPAVLSEAIINGDRTERLANNINISLPNLTSEELLLELDKYGISAGSGSACTARSVEPSHVLRAIGVPKEYLQGALRFSLGRGTNKKQINQLSGVLPKIVRNLEKRLKSL